MGHSSSRVTVDAPKLKHLTVHWIEFVVKNWDRGGRKEGRKSCHTAQS